MEMNNNHPKYIQTPIFYEGNALDVNTNGFYFDKFNGSVPCNAYTDNNNGVKWEGETCCINYTRITQPKLTSNQTCANFNVRIDWFTKDGIGFIYFQAYILANFGDPENQDSLTVISATYYPNSTVNGILPLFVYLIIDRIQLHLPVQNQVPVNQIGHFVFIDVLITLQNASHSYNLSTSSSIAMYKYSGVYYNSDGSPFSEANPCATKSVDIISDDQSLYEYANMTSRSKICCTNWVQISQKTTEATTTSTKTDTKKSYTWLIILCIVIPLLI
uniref:Uncharacterized protein n=1 Tax=Acrobeloides nanus TaxID=290746 RepID=A0A914ELD6_9BILA